jgi:hypothetical protein
MNIVGSNGDLICDVFNIVSVSKCHYYQEKVE